MYMLVSFWTFDDKEFFSNLGRQIIVHLLNIEMNNVNQKEVI